MSPTPEEKARIKIDALLEECGWKVQSRKDANLQAGRGVAVREVSLKRGHGEVDYLLFADGKALGTVEAKPEGWTLRGAEGQSIKYVTGLPDNFPAWRTPLPFAYESTGGETHFTNHIDPEPVSREVFAFHRPETLIDWAQETDTLRRRLQRLPPLHRDNLWLAQATAITNLESSLAKDRPRALIQMATGSGKTFTAVNLAYRLIKFGGARRILFLVDRSNLGEQTLKEFQQFATPDDGRKFNQLYNVQHLQSNVLDPVSNVCIGTIQRLYSMLKGEAELPAEQDEASAYTLADLYKEPLPVQYNPTFPPESFDFIITDECHRSIYNLWRQVLEYFDAYLIGLTATPSKQTIGFFRQNLVMEYNHAKAVADGVNVPYDVYRIRTDITEKGGKVDAGFYVDKRDRLTRAKRWEQLDEVLEYPPNQLDRDVVAEDQIRTVIRTFRDKLFTEIFPGREDVPKTLIFAKDDSHAEDIVRVVREEFGRGNEFCKKITYRTTGEKPRDLIASFRNSYNPRIAVTVDMIATGTDVKPLEVVFFMRSIKSLGFFEQMKGRGVRVIPDTEFQSVTKDAKTKTHFVIVDAVGVCERDKTDSRPLETKRHVPFDKLLEQIGLGKKDADTLASMAGRLARLGKQLGEKEIARLKEMSGGKGLSEIVGGLLSAVDPDNAFEAAKVEFKRPDPTAAQIEQSAKKLAETSVAPLATRPELRNELIRLQREAEQTIDTVSKDTVLEAGFSAALEAAQYTARSFEQFIAEHKDEITALQILYSQPHRRRLTFDQVRELAEVIGKPPRRWTPDTLWRAYEALDKSKVRGSGRRILTDMVSLVKYALRQDPMLAPFADTVEQRYQAWIAQQVATGHPFTEEQRQWLDLIRDHIANSLTMEADDFELPPFNQHGGLARAHKLFGPTLPKILDELNEALAA